MKRNEPIIDITIRFNEAISYLSKEIKGFTQSGFAKESSLSPAAITESVKLRSNVGVMAIQNIVKNYNISPEWLMLGEGDMIKKNPLPSSFSSEFELLMKNISEKDLEIKQLIRENERLKIELGNLKEDAHRDDDVECVDAERHQQAG